MQTKFLRTLMLFSVLMPSVIEAATGTVTITWNISDTTNIKGYKIYYAYDAQMSNKSLACEAYTNPTTTTSLTCNNFTINAYPYYVAVAAVQTDNAEIISQSQKIIEAQAPVILDMKIQN